MKVEFAPLNIPLARRLQTAAVLQWVLSFLLLAQVCLGIIVLLIIYNYWFLYIPYLTWLYFDWQTPEQGGRRSDWVRSWTIWRYFKDYFPIQLVKTWDLDPSHNYIFGFHPHGVLVVGAFGNFCTNYSEFKELFPGFTAYLHVLPFWFRCPFFREYLMSSGPVSVSKKSVSHVLRKKGGGNISVIVLGGAEESLDAHPGKFTLFIRQRKGFVKMALTHGAYLVPVFSFGENELFKQISNPEGSWLRTVQEKLQKIMGFALPLFHARGIFQYNFGLMPYRKPIHTVVGRPIPVPQTLHPTSEQIEELHQTYMEELRKLFEAHKGKYAVDNWLPGSAKTGSESPISEEGVNGFGRPPCAVAVRLCTSNIDYCKVMTCSIHQANFNFPESNKKRLLSGHVLCHEQNKVDQIPLTQKICTAALLGQKTLCILRILS